MLAVIDNYDSFTYNLVQYCGQAGAAPQVWRNDAIDVEGLLAHKPKGILLSPGPGNPAQAGLCIPLLRHLIAHDMDIPVLGVCLGHQALIEACGGLVDHAPQPVHGKTSPITHDTEGVFAGLPSPLNVTRYHSLIGNQGHLGDGLSVTSQSEDRLIMGVRHQTLPLEGVQFHPESIATEYGLSMIENFVNKL